MVFFFKYFCCARITGCSSFILQKAADEFDYLQQGIAVVLIFIGAKRFLEIIHIHIPVWVSLAVIILCIGGGIFIFSLIITDVKAHCHITMINASALQSVLKATLLSEGEDFVIEKFWPDSRKINRPGTSGIIALVTDRRNAHQFIQEVYEAGFAVFWSAKI